VSQKGENVLFGPFLVKMDSISGIYVDENLVECVKGVQEDCSGFLAETFTDNLLRLVEVKMAE